MLVRSVLRHKVLILGMALAASMISSSAYAQASCVDRCGANSPGCWCTEACYTFGTCCQDYESQCVDVQDPTPIILSISPTSVPESGGAITITGTNFQSPEVGTRRHVFVGAADCLVTSWSDVLIECNAPPGQGSDVIIEVLNGLGLFGYTAAGQGLNYVAAVPVPALGYYGLVALASLLTLGAFKPLRPASILSRRR